jgi:hypothetical protein
MAHGPLKQIYMSGYWLQQVVKWKGLCCSWCGWCSCMHFQGKRATAGVHTGRDGKMTNSADTVSGLCNAAHARLVLLLWCIP